MFGLIYYTTRKYHSFYYFQVRDGGGLYARLLGQFCGNVSPLPVISTSNMLWIRFYSDGTTEGAGATATLDVVDCKKFYYFENSLLHTLLYMTT